jgi:hypothetical protein
MEVCDAVLIDAIFVQQCNVHTFHILLFCTKLTGIKWDGVLSFPIRRKGILEAAMHPER